MNHSQLMVAGVQDPEASEPQKDELNPKKRTLSPEHLQKMKAAREAKAAAKKAAQPAE